MVLVESVVTEEMVLQQVLLVLLLLTQVAGVEAAHQAVALEGAEVELTVILRLRQAQIQEAVVAGHQLTLARVTEVQV
jgi:hypothetical protein